MGRYKFSGVNSAKASKEAARRFEVYDGPTPPRAPYLVKIQKMTIKANANGDPMITTSVVVDEPTKKSGKTNPKARYNGAFAMDRQNVTEQSAGYVNAFLEALGCTPADIKSFWSTGVVTEEIPNQTDVDAVKQLGKVKPVGKQAIALLGMGNARTAGGKTYDARLEVQSWLVASQLVGEPSGADDEDDDIVDEDEAVDEEEVEDEEVDEEDEVGEDEEDEELVARQVELEGMTRAQLRAALKAAGSDLKVTTKVKDEEIVNAILDIEFPEDEEEVEAGEEEEEPEEEEEDEGDELDQLSRVQLKKRLLADGISFKVLKSTTDDEIREAIRAGAGDEEENEEEDEPEPATKPAKVPPRTRRSKLAGEPPF